MAAQNSKTCYRQLTNYKYQLTEDFNFNTEIEGYKIDTGYIKLNTEGVIVIVKNYAWDGASGPTRDSESSMRASLVHNAFYQLLREEHLPQTLVLTADKLFKSILLQDGMSTFRAWYWYKGLRLANGSAAKPNSQNPVKPVCLPLN